MTAVVHIAGLRVEVNNQLRQRCAWCGATLIDYALDRVMVPVDQPGPPATWPVGGLVAVDGNASYACDHDPTQPLPDGACALLDPEVTT